MPTSKDNPTPWQRLHLVAALLAAAGVPVADSHAQQTELLLLGPAGDTIARERTRSGTGQFHLELFSPMLGARFAISIDLLASGVPTAMTNRFWRATDPDTAPPRETAHLTFAGDSVHVDIAGRPVQRLGSREGALPFLNPSFGLIELFLARAEILGGDRVEVPAFLVQGGRTVPVTIMRFQPDSAVVNIAGTEARLRVDQTGAILGGVVPSQGLRLVRAPVTGPWSGVPPPDYSAPDGAPYQAIPVRIPTPMGHELAGTLTLPLHASSERPVPAVVTATGSGLQDRDESLPNLPGYRLFRQVADTLSRHGIAVLRMDDRGFGESGGNGATATSADFAEDIRAGLDWLGTRPEIDSGRLGIVGHSEGGLLAPMLAAADTTLAAIVLMAGPSRTGREIIAYQQESAIGRLPGLTAGQRDSLARQSRQAVDSMAAVQPWMRYFLDYNPLPTARRVRHAAVLILHGETDLQVTVDQAMELEGAFRAAGNRDVTVRIFAGTNHLFLDDPVGDPAQYARLTNRQVRPEVLGALVDWLVARFAP
jgi:dipeptidyl aminopeptidase/acylaminoacyl peptidase